MKRLSATDIAEQLEQQTRAETIAMIRTPSVSDTQPDSARAAVESARGESYTDAEWREARQTLRDFVRIHEDWNRAQ